MVHKRGEAADAAEEERMQAAHELGYQQSQQPVIAALTAGVVTGGDCVVPLPMANRGYVDAPAGPRKPQAPDGPNV